MSSDRSSRRNTLILLVLGAIAICAAMVWLMVDRVRFDSTPSFSEETVLPSREGNETQAILVETPRVDDAPTISFDYGEAITDTDDLAEADQKVDEAAAAPEPTTEGDDTVETTVVQEVATAEPDNEPPLGVLEAAIDELVPSQNIPEGSQAAMPGDDATLTEKTDMAALDVPAQISPDALPAKNLPHEKQPQPEQAEDIPLETDVVAHEAVPPNAEPVTEEARVSTPVQLPDQPANNSGAETQIIAVEPAQDFPPVAGVATADMNPLPEQDLTGAAAPKLDEPLAAPQKSDPLVAGAENTLPNEPKVDARTASVVADPDDPNAPRFDLVRVDAEGTTVIAGTAAPGAKVQIMSDGQALGETIANTAGEFVALVDADVAKPAQTIALLASIDGGPLLRSSDSVVVLGRRATQTAVGGQKTDPANDQMAALNAETAIDEDPIAPAVVAATDEGIRILQPAAILPDQVSLDSISYDDAGEVVITGRGRPGNRIWLYVDQTRASNSPVSAAGTWTAQLAGINKGRYVLRADEIGPDGTVLSRAESPFQREFPTAEKLALLTSDKEVVVQPGNNLWNIAKIKYGEGLKYWVIFNANDDQIRDPDLIYPGQIFALPDEN